MSLPSRVPPPAGFRERRFRPLMLATVFAALLCWVPAASAKTVSGAEGQVQASFSYTQNKDGTEFKDFLLDINRGGVLRLRTRLPDFKGFRPGGFIDQPTLHVRDLDGDREPEVLLNLFSGGAHCCVTALVYRYRAATVTYSPLRQDFGDVGFRLRNLDKKGVVEFLSRDPAFSGAFSSYAESRFAIQVLRLRKGRFADVTARFPALVRRDLATHKRAYKRFVKQKLNARGVLAAMAADQYLLRSSRGARATFTTASKRYGPRFTSSLKRFLKRNGYRL